MPTNLVPKNTGSGSLGTTLKRWESLHAKTAAIDIISSSNGTTDVLANLLVRGDATINGNLTFGNADTDSVSFGADITSDLIPDVGGDYHLGNVSKYWGYVFVENVVCNTVGSFNDITSTGDISTDGNIYIEKNTGHIYLSGNGDGGAYINSIGNNENMYLTAPGNNAMVIASSDDFLFTSGGKNVLVGRGSEEAIGINVTFPNKKGLTVDGIVSASGGITSSGFMGDGSGLTGITAEWDGTHIGDGFFSGDITVGGIFISSSVNRIHGFIDNNEIDLIISASDNDLKLYAYDDISLKPVHSLKVTTGNDIDLTAADKIELDSARVQIESLHITASGNIDVSGSTKMRELRIVEDDGTSIFKFKPNDKKLEMQTGGGEETIVLNSDSSNGGKITLGMENDDGDGKLETIVLHGGESSITLYNNNEPEPELTIEIEGDKSNDGRIRLYNSDEGGITLFDLNAADKEFIVGTDSWNVDSIFQGNVSIGTSAPVASFTVAVPTVEFHASNYIKFLANNDITIESTDDLILRSGNSSGDVIAMEGSIWGNAVSFNFPNANITASSAGFSGDLKVAGNNVDFTNLPTSAAGANTGGLYTQSGSQLPFSGSLDGTGWNTKKFVLVK